MLEGNRDPNFRTPATRTKCLTFSIIPAACQEKRKLLAGSLQCFSSISAGGQRVRVALHLSVQPWTRGLNFGLVPPSEPQRVVQLTAKLLSDCSHFASRLPSLTHFPLQGDLLQGDPHGNVSKERFNFYQL